MPIWGDDLFVILTLSAAKGKDLKSRVVRSLAFYAAQRL
jgi:hypothetical protein